MKHIQTARNLGFVAMLFCGLVALTTPLGATIPGFCSNWSISHGCSCQYNGNYSWTGLCDFSQESNPLELAQDYCNGAFDNCVDSCESSAYLSWLISELCDSPEEPECYEECYFTWAADNSCDQGEVSEFSCGCGYYVWCDW